MDKQFFFNLFTYNDMLTDAADQCIVYNGVDVKVNYVTDSGDYLVNTDKYHQVIFNILRQTFTFASFGTDGKTFKELTIPQAEVAKLCKY